MDNFLSDLLAAQETSRSCLCVGLDPDPAKLPHCLSHLPLEEAVIRFCEDIIRVTSPVVCAYKPNFAFFESLGPGGHAVLKHIVDAIPDDRVVIGDAKRGDIGNTARMYAKAIFGIMGCSACTVSPYMGSDAVAPFLDWPGRGVFVLIRTSNPGAREIQEMQSNGIPLYLHMAKLLNTWAENRPGIPGIVAGATDLEALRTLRAHVPQMPFLIPGVGAQGGRAEDVLSAASGGPVVVNSSRQILYASDGEDYAEAAERAAIEMAGKLPA